MSESYSMEQGSANGERHLAWICMGSNQENPAFQLQRAEQALASLKNVRIEKSSSVYRTEPQLVKDQPWFFNRVLCLSLPSFMTAERFLRILLDLEIGLGRIRSGRRYGPRVIDLDLLLFDDVCMESDFLTLPHPRIKERAFVLVPLHEADSELRFPDGSDVRSALEALEYTLEDDVIRQP
ncbi:MAG: 2-amino-4-hydroxy-6-hydroxymethyldihydropteridine diphosphokinase [Desulfovibrionaceae bacterium]|nr:2-amino-4-hydroxy-6-hydroxymethyldihydropteridine diphosphokinase [Desulfovibrionaceae bacterium]